MTKRCKRIAERKECRRQQERGEIRIEPEQLEGEEGREQRRGQQRAVREIDDVQHAVDQRQPKRDQRIDRAGQQAVEDRGDQDDGRQHGHALEGRGAGGAHARRPRSRHVTAAASGKPASPLAKASRQDHLDVVVEHLRVDRRRALVLAVDELGRPIGHDVAREGRTLQRRGDLGPVGGAARSSASATSRRSCSSYRPRR